MNTLKDTRPQITVNLTDWLVTINAGLNVKKFSSKDLRMVEMKNHYGENRFIHSDTGLYAGETKISGIKVFISGVAEPLQYSVRDYTEYSLIAAFNTLTDIIKNRE